MLERRNFSFTVMEKLEVEPGAGELLPFPPPQHVFHSSCLPPNQHLVTADNPTGSCPWCEQRGWSAAFSLRVQIALDVYLKLLCSPEWLGKIKDVSGGAGGAGHTGSGGRPGYWCSNFPGVDSTEVRRSDRDEIPTGPAEQWALFPVPVVYGAKNKKIRIRIPQQSTFFRTCIICFYMEHIIRFILWRRVLILNILCHLKI